MAVSCLADGVQVEIHLAETGFNGVLYVKGHSKDEECRRVINLSGDSSPRTEIFKVHFGSCGLFHVNGLASFVLVIQKHPKLVTYKAQAYQIRCVYQTGEQNVTLGFNVQMLTTAGTIANTGPPPQCTMKIVRNNGDEINSAEIGDNLMLQVEVQPASKLTLNFILTHGITDFVLQLSMVASRDHVSPRQWRRMSRMNISSPMRMVVQQIQAFSASGTTTQTRIR